MQHLFLEIYVDEVHTLPSIHAKLMSMISMMHYENK